MIVFAAVASHSPMLIPSVGKEHTEKLVATRASYEELSKQLYLARPDALVIISPHAQMYPDAFCCNMAQSYRGSLKEFGDHGTEISAKAHLMLTDRIHRHMRGANIPFTLTSSEELDYGFTVPLIMLGADLATVGLIPLSVSLLEAEQHVTFGRELQNILQSESARVAVIASADLSHYANQQSPLEYRKEGEDFDQAMRAGVQARDIDGLLKLDPNMLERAGQYGYKPIMMLLGCLDGINCTPKELSYEAPFGVGHLMVRFDFA